MPTRTQNLAISDSGKPPRTRYATQTDIEQLTRAIDRVRNDSTRYLICMVMDLVTQQIAAQEQEEGSCDKDVAMN
jgi:hypothetical protein